MQCGQSAQLVHAENEYDVENGNKVRIVSYDTTDAGKSRPKPCQDTKGTHEINHCNRGETYSIVYVQSRRSCQ